MSDAADFLKAVQPFFEFMFKNFGPWGSLFIVILFVAGGLGWRIYNNLRKDKEVNQAVAAKDEEIKRMADEVRLYRALVFTRILGMPQQEVDRLVARGGDTTPEAGKSLEHGPPPLQQPYQQQGEPTPRTGET
jgi:hypothetical protein